MNEDIQTIYLLIRGYEYEGSGVLSLHRTEQGVRDAADAYMKDDVCYLESGWEEDDELVQDATLGVLAEWHCGGQYLQIVSRELWN